MLSADLFNVTERRHELCSAIATCNSAAFDSINEIISPRILRIGVKFTVLSARTVRAQRHRF